MKVIGFDGWTVGAHHYQRLMRAFASRGLELTLIHLGSWGSEKGRPAQETLGDLGVRDISFYRGSSFAEILEREDPAAVIFLSMNAFAHRAFNRYCRQRRVPTIHVFHGLDQLIDTVPTASAYKRLWRMRIHVIKSLRHFMPVYARSLWETSASAADWYRFAQDIGGRVTGRGSRVARSDSRADRACVYIESEVGRAIEIYGYPERHVRVVGNPDLADFGITADLAGCCTRRSLLSNRAVLYIDSALFDYGAVYHSKSEFIEHLIASNEELSRQGKRLLLKPHPSTGRDITSAVSAAGIEVVSKRDFVSVLLQCCACLTEPSTAALIPAVLGMPLMLAQYDQLGGQRFGELLSGYPRARPLTDLRKLSAVLTTEQGAFDRDRTVSWIDRNIGPLPAEEMPNRVADVVVSVTSSLTAGAAGQGLLQLLK